MLQIFYKEKPIIISDKKSDLKNSLIIKPELFEHLDLLKLLTKNKINSIGIFSNEFESILRMFKKKYPEIKLSITTLRFSLFTEIKSGIYQKEKQRKMKTLLKQRLGKLRKKQESKIYQL